MSQDKYQLQAMGDQRTNEMKEMDALRAEIISLRERVKHWEGAYEIAMKQCWEERERVKELEQALNKTIVTNVSPVLMDAAGRWMKPFDSALPTGTKEDE
jgi:flagellar motility protein MotE (MotC chaperone)